MSIGGWSILNKWLIEAKKTENFPVLVDLLEVFKKWLLLISKIMYQGLKLGLTGCQCDQKLSAGN